MIIDEEADELEIWHVPVKDLLRQWNPFAAWSEKPIEISEVQEAIENGWLDPSPYETQAHLFLDRSGDETRHYHRCRIAWLVVHYDPTPIEIDVGAPSLGWHPTRGKFDFIDGNHRLCAAAIRGDPMIRVSYGGECAQMAAIFPKGFVET